MEWRAILIGFAIALAVVIVLAILLTGSHG